MVRVASLFSQLLQEFPRHEFASLVRKHGVERGAKGFKCWTQFVAMLFCHLARADSLREICHGLACCTGKLAHLGVGSAPPRSTLSYANIHRDAAFFEDLFWTVLGRFRQEKRFGAKRRFQFKNKLLSLDATTISLCLNLFPWADFRRAKGGVKLHVLLDHADYMPEYAVITPARQHEVKMARHFSLKPGSIIVVDRGYIDYALFYEWHRAGVYFVIRLKDDADYEILEDRPLSNHPLVLADQQIRFMGPQTARKCPVPLRLVRVWDDVNGREITLLTNHEGFAASTIGAIYKERWQIEIFFKTLKQRLRIKTFVGTTENALRIQIWTALIALVLLRWLHYLSQAAWSLSVLAAMLRLNLFTHRDLRDWLDQPYDVPPLIPTPVQLPLDLPMSWTAPSSMREET